LRLRSVIAEQEAVLNRIRDLVISKRRAADCGQGVEGKGCLNALTEIYNTTIISSNTSIKKLEYYSESQGFIQSNQTLNIYSNNVAPWNPSQPNISNKPINFITIDQQNQFKPQPAPIYIPNNKPQPQVNPVAPNQQILLPYSPNQPIPQPQILINPPNTVINQQQKPIPQPQPNQQIFINPPSPSINQQQRPILILPSQQNQPNPAPIQPVPAQIIPQQKPAPIQPAPAQIIPQQKPAPIQPAPVQIIPQPKPAPQ
jgi:hypothetical protein